MDTTFPFERDEARVIALPLYAQKAVAGGLLRAGLVRRDSQRRATPPRRVLAGQQGVAPDERGARELGAARAAGSAFGGPAAIRTSRGLVAAPRSQVKVARR